jgi:hypothetical protein
MLITILCITFGSLTFKGLTLQALFAWFCNHPFLFFMALNELVHERIYIRFNK